MLLPNNQSTSVKPIETRYYYYYYYYYFINKCCWFLFHERWKKNSDGVIIEDNGQKVLEFVAVQRKDNQQWAIPGVSLVICSS